MQTSTPTTHHTRFWIVEDAKPFRSLLKKWIQRGDGWVCDREFENATHLLKALTEEELPEILLLDLGLPGLSGADALPKIRELAPQLPVIVLTAHDGEQEVLRAIGSGATGYLLKDTTPESFVERIEEALDGGAPLHPLAGKYLLKRLQGARTSSNAKLELTDPLSPRELETLRLLSQGLAKKEIANKLELSIHTVDTYLRAIYRKLDVRSNTEAVAKALRGRLL